MKSLPKVTHLTIGTLKGIHTEPPPPTALSAGMWFSRTSKYSPHSTPFLNPSWPLFTWNQCQVNVRDRLLEPEAGAARLADTQPGS